MRAIQSVAVAKAAIVDVQEPVLKPDSVLVRPHYVGNNPCDWLVTDVEPMFTQSQMIGCDYCGVVEKIGSDVKTDLKPGDKVCGAVAGGVGCDASRGCFGELFPAYGDFVFPLPKNIAEPQAATLGVGISTIAVAFYEHMKIPLPDDNPNFGQGKPFFVYAGSSAMGLFGIQFAKLSGFRVITTCSSRNFDLVKSYGADEAYDYHDIEKCTKEIKQSVGNELHYAYICVSDENSPQVMFAMLPNQHSLRLTEIPALCRRLLKQGRPVCDDCWRRVSQK
jgi:NADPH:quinone reductase-like Zn-dependent oxidoreductase